MPKIVTEDDKKVYEAAKLLCQKFAENISRLAEVCKKFVLTMEKEKRSNDDNQRSGSYKGSGHSQAKSKTSQSHL